jgi:hypothetical protein
MFAEEYGRQKNVLGSSGLVVLSSLLIWERKLRRGHIGEEVGGEDATR